MWWFLLSGADETRFTPVSVPGPDGDDLAREDERASPGSEHTTSPDDSPRPDVAASIRSEATDIWVDTVAVDRFVGKGGAYPTFHRGIGDALRNLS